jgi:hypothetical protein
LGLNHKFGHLKVARSFIFDYTEISFPAKLNFLIKGSEFYDKLRLGAQSVTLLSTLRDPTQLRQRQCATRQHPFVAHQKEGIDQPKEVQHHIGGGQQ